MDFNNPFRELEERWSSGDRYLGARHIWKVLPQEFDLHPQDPLKSFPRAVETLATHGELVFGFVMQSPDSLDAPGRDSQPALVIYQRTSVSQCEMKELWQAVITLHELSAQSPNDPDAAPLIRCISDHYSRVFHLSVAEHIAKIPSVALSVMLVLRRHIPGDYLRKPWLPLLIAPERTPHTMLLPSQIWTATLLRSWLAE